MTQQPYVPFAGRTLPIPDAASLTNGNVITGSDATGSGAFIGQLWINNITNNVWYWTSSGWVLLIGS